MPKYRRLYSPIFGEVEFIHTCMEEERPILVSVKDNCFASFFADGRYSDSPDSECLLFPSKEVRDWCRCAEVLVKDGDLIIHRSGRAVRFDHRSMDCDDIGRFASEEEVAEQEKKDASVHVAQAVEPFNPFDRVLVCNNKKERLIPRLFSQKIGELFYCQDGKSYKFCIPYDGNEGAQYIV